MEKKHFRSLEGIRAYAFLLVFAVHYTSSMRPLDRNGSLLRDLWCLLGQVSWVAVPIFFVLSGFVITGVLLETQYLKGYFRVFYQRRAIRILPLYYLILLVLALTMVASHVRATWHFLGYIFYLQNWITSWDLIYRIGPYADFGHLWSLAVEEQFYLVWPVVIFLIRSRTKLLGFCYGGMLVAAVVRICWPMTHQSYLYAYESSLTRGDALMMGAAIALHLRGPAPRLKAWLWPARLVLTMGTGLLVSRALLVGQALPLDYFGLMVLTPVVNLMAAAIVILAIEPETLVSRLCRRTWAVKLGGMSYSLYLVHEPFSNWFREVLQPWLVARMGCETIPMAIVLAVAFAFTWGVARMTYRFVERPGMEMKKRFLYGPVCSPRAEAAPSLAAEGVLRAVA